DDSNFYTQDSALRTRRVPYPPVFAAVHPHQCSNPPRLQHKIGYSAQYVCHLTGKLKNYSAHASENAPSQLQHLRNLQQIVQDQVQTYPRRLSITENWKLPCGRNVCDFTSLPLPPQTSE